MRLLITGGCGFVGSNLAREALARGCELTVLDNLERVGSAENLAWLEGLGLRRFVRADVSDARAVDSLIAETRPEAVFHLAGQVAMTRSMENPRRDFEVNALGTLNVLEAVRKHVPAATVAYSSTNKVYGDLGSLRVVEEATRYRLADFPEGLAESTPLEFSSPYGCSKGAAEQYLLDYARTYGLRTVVFRHSTIYGPRQTGTFDQGWIAWFCQKAVEQAADAGAPEFTIAGDGKQVRDVLHADDVVRLYFKGVDEAVRGRAFNIGGGMANSLSLLELFGFMEERLGIRLRYRRTPWRVSDQRVFVADNARISAATGWRPQVAFADGIGALVDSMRARSQ